MPTLLAAQLAKSISLNAPLLSESTRKKNLAASYLFTPHTDAGGQLHANGVAAVDDPDTIYALASNALAQLSHAYPSLASTLLEESADVNRLLFSHAAKDTDRTLLARDEGAQLSNAIKMCLAALGPYLLETATGRIIEWLVRRFRVHEFDVPAVLALFLPYHESPHFAKMISILVIDKKSPWAFLEAFKKAGKPLPRSVLVTEMRKSRDFARFVVELLPEALAVSENLLTVHRTLLCFNTSVLLEYVTRAEGRDLDAGVLAFFLTALFEPLRFDEITAKRNLSKAIQKDAILGSFVLLSAVSHRCALTSTAVESMASSMIHCAAMTSSVSASQLLTALISFLSAQDVLDHFANSTVGELINYPEFDKALQASLTWSGLDKVLIPMLGYLVNETNETNGSLIIQHLFSWEGVPETITKPLIRLVAQSSGISTEIKSLLSELYQRNPELVQGSLENGDRRADMEQLLLDIAMTENSGGVPQDIVISAASADPVIRANSIRRVIQILNSGAEGLSAGEVTALQDALLTRIYDSNASVLAALYEVPAPILPLISQPSALKSLASSLLEQGSSRSVLRAHLAFLCNALYVAYPDSGLHVLLEIVLPHGLFSKPRYKTAVSVWEIILTSPLGDHKLLRGLKTSLAGVIGAAEQEKSNLAPEDMTKVNDDIATKLAKNFQASNEFPILLEWLVDAVQDGTDAHRRLFSLLIMRRLLQSLSGEHQIDAANKMLHAINFADISDIGKFGDDENTFDEAIFEDAVAKGIVLKPNSRSTQHRVELALIACLATVKKPVNAQINWFAGVQNIEKDTRGQHFLQLQQSIYQTINSSSVNCGVVLHINKVILQNFGPESLLFLLSLLDQRASNAVMESEASTYIALRHALAFIRAQSTEKPADFQTILPGLLYALQSFDMRVRQASMDCISALSALSAAPKPSVIYAYDKIYGSASASLQYLDWSDLGKYLQILSEHRDHLGKDAAYASLLHHEFLVPSRAEGKKDAKQRSKILCFLLSHIACCPSSLLSLALLQTLNLVSDAVKIEMLLPVIEKALDTSNNSSEFDRFTALALGAFDESAVQSMNDNKNSSWTVFLKAIRQFGSQESKSPQWTSLCERICNNLPGRLSHSRQLELCVQLIELGSARDDANDIKRLLSHCVKQSALIIALLRSLQPNPRGSSERASKRAKTDMPTSQGETDTLTRLTMLLEVLSSLKLPGSLELVSVLLETLSRTMLVTTSHQADLVYIEQLLMTCIESAASEIKELPNLAPSTIRLDVLVDLIRTAENPSTFHQVLLLMASLARLSPESALHNVMPIFTFMGSNVFHRDDSYSFKVIQKTTDSIVPVVTASLKKKHDKSLDLYIGARDFLRTFTDASAHIPRHRRTSFFTHLVDVLNPAEFLAPVIMLLANKVSNRVPKLDHGEAPLILALPLSTLAHYSATLQIRNVKEILLEVQRLFNLVKNPASTNNTAFLEANSADEQSISPSAYRKRQCQTLLVLIGCGMRQISPSSMGHEPTDDLRHVISILLELGAVDEVDMTDENVSEIGLAARWALVNTLSVISVAYFSSTVLSMLSSDSMKIKQGALDLLAEKVPAIKPEARGAISVTMSQIIGRIKEMLSSARDRGIISCSMKALSNIVTSASAKEESALSEVLPVVLNVIDNRIETQHALAVIPPLVLKLGPRIIPHLQRTVNICVSVLRVSKKDLNLGLAQESLQALSSLLKVVPTFWGTQELNTVVDVYLEGGFAQSSAFSKQFEKTIKHLAREVPSKTLLSALIQSWPSADMINGLNGVERFGRFFALLKRSLHFSPLPVILENLRGLSKNLLEALDIRKHLPTGEATALEDSVISAYLELVIKLNETSFQPIFRKSCDWAFGDAAAPERKLTFCRLYAALLDLLKELITPYMSLIINNVVELLTSFQKNDNNDAELWTVIIDMLKTSFSVDDGAYWIDDRLQIISAPLIQQLPVCISLKIDNGKSKLSDCLTVLVECTDDTSLLKSINLGTLLHTRSENVRLRLYALSCSVALWQSHSKKLSGFGPETATFIMECAEDENDDVVRECHKLKNAVEAEVGKIDGL